MLVRARVYVEEVPDSCPSTTSLPFERSVKGQRASDIGLGPVVVPGAKVQVRQKLFVIEGTLAVQVDHTAGLARAAVEGIGSPDDLHIVKLGEVLIDALETSEAQGTVARRHRADRFR